MYSSVQYFDLIKATKGIESDYRLAKYLCVTQAAICSHRKKRYGMDAQTAIKVAQALKLDPAIVILSGIIESAKHANEKSALMRLLVLAELNGRQLSYGMARDAELMMNP